MTVVRCLRCRVTFVTPTHYLHPAHRCVTVNHPSNLPTVDGDRPSRPDNCPPVGTVTPIFDRQRKRPT